MPVSHFDNLIAELKADPKGVGYLGLWPVQIAAKLATSVAGDTLPPAPYSVPAIVEVAGAAVLAELLQKGLYQPLRDMAPFDFSSQETVSLVTAMLTAAGASASLAALPALEAPQPCTRAEAIYGVRGTVITDDDLDRLFGFGPYYDPAKAGPDGPLLDASGNPLYELDAAGNPVTRTVAQPDGTITTVKIPLLKSSPRPFALSLLG
jgi:hypothetical protein